MKLGLDISTASLIPNLLNQIVADYQAKFGTFLTLKSKLNNLRTRITRVVAIPAYQVSAAELQTAANGLAANQTVVESAGMAFIGNVYSLQSDPVFLAVKSGNLPDIVEVEKWAKLVNMYNFLTGAKSELEGLLTKIDNQIVNVGNLESSVVSLENQAGIKPYTGINFAAIPTWVYPAVIITLTVVTKGFGLYKMSKRR